MPDQSASFSTRTAAKDWAHRTESELKQTRYFPHDAGKNRTSSLRQFFPSWA